MNIKWAPLIPLIGGLPLGAEKAFGCKPDKIYSYDGFQSNDSHYVNYMKPIEYVIVDNDTKYEALDVVLGTPPCSGLSLMNTGTTAESRGAECHKNDWMYQIFKDGIDKFSAKVVLIENAPALFTKNGIPVANKIYDICKERGYSLTLYKTSTSLHGIPQNRDRTFAIAWKSKTAPIMNWYNKEKDDWKDYLLKSNGNQNIEVNLSLTNDPYWNFIKHISNEDPRELLIKSDKKTAFVYVVDQNLLNQALEWFKDTKNIAGIKTAEHAIMKFSINKGVWDASIRVFGDCMNAVIGRNIQYTIHPFEDRSLTISECLHMMGFPDDFELLNPTKNINHIAQNVPVCTATDILSEVKKFINNELILSESDFIRQNNYKHTIEYVKGDQQNDRRKTISDFI